MDNFRTKLRNAYSRIQARSMGSIFNFYFTAAFTFFNCPFRISQNRYTKRWSPQLLFCVFIKAAGLLRLVQDLSFVIPTNWKKPSMYFVFLENIMVAVEVVYFEKLVWSRQLHVTEFTHLIQEVDREIPRCKRSLIVGNALGVLTWLIYNGIASTQIFPWISCKEDVSDNTGHVINCYFCQWWVTVINAAWRCPFVPVNQNSTIGNPNFNTLLVSDHIAGVIGAFGLYYK